MLTQTLSNVQRIEGAAVIHMDTLRELHPERFTETGAMDHVWFEKTIRPFNFIYIRHDKNSLSFTLQNGPVKDVGINGVQVEQIIGAARDILKGFQATYPNKQNACAITKLEEAIHWLDARTKEREERGVEGTLAK